MKSSREQFSVASAIAPDGPAETSGISETPIDAAAVAPVHALHVVAAGEYGGAEAQMLDLLQGLRADGVSVAVAVLFDAEFAQRAREAGIAVHVLQGGGLLRDYRALLDVARRVRPRILHTHGVRASVAGRLVGARLRTPVVTTVHSDLYFDYAAPLKRSVFMALERATRGLSARVIAVSRPLADILRGRGYPAHKLVVVENGLDIEAFDARLRAGKDAQSAAATRDAHAARAAADDAVVGADTVDADENRVVADDSAPQAGGVDLRRSLGLSEETLVVLCVARLHPVKLHGVLIRAIGEVAREMDGAHLALVGDGGERRALQALAMEAAPGHVHFLGARSDVPALLLQADVFALASRMEGLPISMLEAMAAQLPVVASRTGGLVDLVVDAGAGSAGDAAVREDATGFLCDPGSVEGLRAALDVLLHDAALRRKLGMAGRERLLARFTKDAMVRRTVDVYKSVSVTHMA